VIICGELPYTSLMALLQCNTKGKETGGIHQTHLKINEQSKPETKPTDTGEENAIASTSYFFRDLELQHWK